MTSTREDPVQWTWARSWLLCNSIYNVYRRWNSLFVNAVIKLDIELQYLYVHSPAAIFSRCWELRRCHMGRLVQSFFDVWSVVYPVPCGLSYSQQSRDINPRLNVCGYWSIGSLIGWSQPAIVDLVHLSWYAVTLDLDLVTVRTSVGRLVRPLIAAWYLPSGATLILLHAHWQEKEVRSPNNAKINGDNEY